MTTQIMTIAKRALLIVACALTATYSYASDVPQERKQKKTIWACDENKDKKISREEAKGKDILINNFDKLDTNKDGFLVGKEIKVLWKDPKNLPRKAGKKAKAAKKAKKTIWSADVNKDKKITRAEAEGNKVLMNNFDKMDADGNGEITVKEMKAFWAAKNKNKKK